MDNESKIEDLQSVSQQILSDVDRLKLLEEEKRTVDPASARFHALAEQIARLSAEIAMASHAEADLADELVGEPGLPTVDEADREA